MTKNRIIYFLWLLFCVNFFVWYYGPDAWYILFFTLVLPIISLILTLISRRYVTIELTAPNHTERGTDSEVDICVRYSGPMVCPRVYARFSLGNYRAKGQSAKLVLYPNSPISLPLRTVHCGVLSCTIEKTGLYDHLGLFRIPLNITSNLTTMVTPVAKAPDQMPDISSFSAVSYRPKYGGGFSEIHEMREYRPGDAIRDIHWKLSAKSDSLIIREAQVPDNQLAVITFDIIHSGSLYDSVLDKLLWTSKYLLENSIPHDICWIDPETHSVSSFSISSTQDINSLFSTLLPIKARDDTPSIHGTAFSCRQFHIEPDGEKEGDD